MKLHLIVEIVDNKVIGVRVCEDSDDQIETFKDLITEDALNYQEDNIEDGFYTNGNYTIQMITTNNCGFCGIS